MRDRLTIDGARYAAARILTLTPDRPGAPVYILARDAAGRIRCTCPDHTHRREAAGDACKHALAAAAAGLI